MSKDREKDSLLVLQDFVPPGLGGVVSLRPLSHLLFNVVSTSRSVNVKLRVFHHQLST